MAKQVRIKTKYPGVFLVDSISPATGKPDQIIYIRYKKDGKLIEEKAGRSSVDAMTTAKAAQIRSMRMAGKSLSNTERRAQEQAVKATEAARWPIDRIWTAYNDAHDGRSCAKGDASYFSHIPEHFRKKTPSELITLDLERLRRDLANKKASKGPRIGQPLAPQTIKHVLSLLKRMLRWAADMGHIDQPIHLKFNMPHVDNEKTEFMSSAQLQAYLHALDEEADQDAAAFFRFMLLTGIRRTALLNLQWSDVDFENGYVTLRGEVAKNEKTQTLPLSVGAIDILEKISRYDDSLYIWPGKNNGPREDFRRMGRRLRDKAGLPKDWRPCHMLRHTFASSLASSGVNIYELQKLLTHGSSAMTQRYAHLADDALRRAASVADQILAVRETDDDKQQSAS